MTLAATRMTWSSCCTTLAGSTPTVDGMKKAVSARHGSEGGRPPCAGGGAGVGGQWAARCGSHGSGSEASPFTTAGHDSALSARATAAAPPITVRRVKYRLEDPGSGR